jgi:hypothetical protein
MSALSVWCRGSAPGLPHRLGAAGDRGAGPDRTIVDGIGVNLKSGNLRALFQLEEGKYIIEGLTFRNGRNGHNGAGVRLLRTEDTIIRRCLFTSNDMGIMTTDHGGLLIEYSEFSFNGTPEFNGYSHNTYIHGDRVTVRFSYLHDGAAVRGQPDLDDREVQRPEQDHQEQPRLGLARGVEDRCTGGLGHGR